jgi:hypothetical protein
VAQRWIETASSLARRRSVRAAAGVFAAAGVASGSMPLLEQPGYELGEALALAAALVAPFLGFAAAREERASPAPSPLSAWAGASLVLAVLLALAFGGALVRAALGPCTALSAAAWFVPVLALPSALLAPALAVAASFLAGGRRGPAALGYASAAAASLAASLHAAYQGAAAFVFDPLLGAWPGPLYDEALAVDLRAILFRAAALAWAVAVAAFAEATVRARRAGMRAATGAAVLAAAAVASALGARSALGALALSGERAAVEHALGGRRDGPRCTVLFPAEKPAPAAAALLAECEFQLADVARALEISGPPRVTAFFYRGADEKRRLVGAAGTEYAKPWLGEIHILDAPLPNPVLRHEMVHAVAAEIASGPLRVPARLGVLVSAGLVEGLAAALETPRGGWTVHEWSRAARDLRLLPDVRALVGPAGFWKEPPARAYAAAGSFLAFLLETRGAGPLREAYRTGDVGAALGEPLDELAAEWQRFLDGVEVPPGLAAAARARLSRGSLFARRCAREVASIERRARGAAARGRTDEACALWMRSSALSGNPEGLKAAGDARARAGDLEGAAAAYLDAAARAGEGQPMLRASIAAARGDVAWRRGDLEAAAAAWLEALAAQPDRADVRLLEAKLVAARDPVLGPAARGYLLGANDPAVSLARVARVDHPLSAYLVGRALLERGEAAAAVPELARATRGPLPDGIAREASRLLGEAQCGAGERARGADSLRSLLGPATRAAERERIGEALRRCAFVFER